MTESVELNLHDLRRRYLKDGLDESNTDANPFKQFELWFKQAQEADLLEPNAMVVATVNADLQPSTRTVLLKLFDERGFVFFTNYTSQKAKDIAHNPKVALQFNWLDLERQVKILGVAEKISMTESMKYFASRPKGSQIGAWVSQQSEVVSSKQVLMAQFSKLKDKFKQGEVPFPDFWGGYRVVPSQIEFWQGGDNRLHDRICYQRMDGQWQKSRLAP
ncbi:MAG: pyridoxamine 5'-phosphate oxidase [Thiomicrorhabdus chilensis]|uniref:pyridoxamine 5'-phosphate oxidase n=1 Tax=Thiomicrorhabdus chilensis TaxID=63656 RepID=UPI00299D90A4|nr:pyridoxamine 5'-phosphate oxidase [Thiomicrorhabdus chilensis]MDX1347806.1 pyridoxamine 5'-phosphate oxidase [Thiomicrorhabdus chilensis]